MDLHGGNIYEFSEEVQKSILDYSSNISPFSSVDYLKEEFIKNISKINRYPDYSYRELTKSLSEFSGVDDKYVIPGNGASEIIFLYMKTVKIRKATIISPTFSEYERALKSIGTEIEHYILDYKNDFKLDIDKFIYSLKSETDLVILCNPNNPTGHFFSIDTIQKLNGRLKERGVKLFIDECFIEFIEGWRAKSAQNLKDSNIFILRALTKYFAIPGLRLGYGISFNREQIKKMWEKKEPWSINTFAEIAGKVLPKNIELIEKTDSWIKEERKFFIKKLKTLKEIKVLATKTNFILIKLEDTTSKILKTELLKRGILIRDASNFRGLDTSFIRIAIKDRESNLKFYTVLKEYFNKKNTESEVELYIMRHGKTLWNELGILQGDEDSELLLDGIKDIIKLKNELYLKHINFDVVCTSPTTRAINTAKFLGYNNYIIKEEFGELKMGEVQGKTYEEFKNKYPEEYYDFLNLPEKYNPRKFKGESYKALGKRVEKGIRDIKKEFKNKKILLITHGVTMQCIISYLEKGKVELEKISEIPLPNNLEIKKIKL